MLFFIQHLKPRTSIQYRPLILWDIVSHILKYRSCKKSECFLRPLRFTVVSVGIIFDATNKVGKVTDECGKLNKSKNL